jgi:hypothetical protein
MQQATACDRHGKAQKPQDQQNDGNGIEHD